MGMNAEYERLLQIGRPPNISRLFSHSKALIVIDMIIDRELVAKGKAQTIAIHGRNSFVIRGAL